MLDTFPKVFSQTGIIIQGRTRAFVKGGAHFACVSTPKKSCAPPPLETPFFKKILIPDILITM